MDPAAAPSAPAGDGLAPFEHRLQQTNARIVQLLDHMAGQATEGAATPTTDTGSAAGASAAGAVSTSAGESTVAPVSLFATCRPFDRSAFLAFVSTYSPLVWSHKSSPALSPLACARLGWVCLGLPSRDALGCSLCHARVDVPISSEVASLPGAEEALCEKYAAILATAHAPDCPWSGNPYEVGFTRILPGGAGDGAGGAATDVWIAMNQLRARAGTLHPYDGMALQDAFVAKVVNEARSAGVPADALSTATLLAICGWEHRAATGSSSSASTATESGPGGGGHAPLQCWFGCRDVSVEPFFAPTASSIDSVTLDIQEEEGKEGDADASDEHLAPTADAVAGESDDEEDRSIFQSPVKRRKLARATVAHSAHSQCEIAPPSAVQPIRSSPDGFDPSRAHRPFCPFARPMPTTGASRPSASGSSAASSAPVRHPSAKYAPGDEQEAEELLGWHQLLRWWLERQGKLTRQPSRPTAEEDANMANDENALPPPNFSPNTAAAAAPISKEQRYRSVVASVRKLLSSSINTATAAFRQ